MQSIIQVENLSKSYGNFKAVDDVSFEVLPGEIFALIGPNGAGKSTIIRIVLDLLKADAGRVAVFGQALNEALKDRIGYLPEERGLYKNVPILDVLVYLGQLKGMRAADAKARATALITQLGLEEHLHSKLTALSKGMAQKVQFVATILHQPDLIIVDEPFSGLDPVNSQVLKDLLYQMRSEGRAVVMSTHQMHQVETMADRVMMIARGQRVVYGAVEAVRQQYAENAVRVEGSGEWAALNGVRQVVNGQQDGVLLHLDSTTTPDEIMQQMAVGNYRIQRFERAVPGLDEIFIRVVGGDLKELR